MPKRPQLDIAALDGFGDPFREPIERLTTVQQPSPVSGSVTPPEAVAEAAAPPKSGRAGKKQAGYIPDQLHKEFKILCVQRGQLQEELLEEAIRDLLTKYRDR